MRNETQHQETLRDILEHFDQAMLVSTERDGTLHARPMMIADRSEDGRELWFVTGLETPKVDEILTEPRVAVTMQDGKRFLTIADDASVVRDRAKIDELWTDAMLGWFPEGKGDPRIALLRVRGEHAEYWDQSGINGIKYAFQLAKAVATGERVKPRSPKQHGTVDLG